MSSKVSILRRSLVVMLARAVGRALQSLVGLHERQLAAGLRGSLRGQVDSSRKL